MVLQAAGNKREKILAYGINGSGKSSIYLDLINWVNDSWQDDKAKPHIHVGSTDSSWDAEDPGGVDGFVHVTNLATLKFDAWISWAEEKKATVKRDDWLVVDLLDSAWPEAQSHYWENMGIGGSLAEVYMMNQRDRDEKGKDAFRMAGDHGANWGIINKYWLNFLIPIVNAPCHVLAICHAIDVPENAPAAVKQFYRVGMRPAGPNKEKTDPVPFFNTVIYCTQRGEDRWTYTTVREKGPLRATPREYLKGAEVAGFVMTYLVSVAGWSL